MRILIVEDEPLIARRVEQFCRKILESRLELLRRAESFDAARAELEATPFDVVLLDLKLHERDGMELLQLAVAGSFHTIVVSANHDQALRAFEFGVLDFVPKPFSVERLERALARVNAPAGRSAHAATRLAVRKHGRVELVAVEDILYVEGSDKYSELVLTNGRRELHDKNLSRLEAVLPAIFERTHKSYLVRMNAVVRLYALEGSRYELELGNGVRLPVGRTRYSALRAQIA
ncbi:MAG TPA: LytTR family DNA-binding domain-containing protein [Opitutaceae bacterium]|jgi:DNA-binding LytR/AlgR family response regulator